MVNWSWWSTSFIYLLQLRHVEELLPIFSLYNLFAIFVFTWSKYIHKPLTMHPHAPMSAVVWIQPVAIENHVVGLYAFYFSCNAYFAKLFRLFLCVHLWANPGLEIRRNPRIDCRKDSPQEVLRESKWILVKIAIHWSWMHKNPKILPHQICENPFRCSQHVTNFYPCNCWTFLISVRKRCSCTVFFWTHFVFCWCASSLFTSGLYRSHVTFYHWKKSSKKGHVTDV